ncbi:MAG: hypothetical protein HY279_06040 [Nitrospinae bacterium]|nr:hypothetical protein [Nitrospinota bacterium]
MKRQRTENRGQKTEVRSQKSEARRQNLLPHASCLLSLASCLLLLAFYLLPLASCLLPLTAVEAAKPRLSTVILEGEAEVADENYISARETAIKNAMRKAVENIVADSVNDPEILEANRENLEESIYKNYDDFVQSYKVLGETQDKNAYSVTLQMNIFENSIKKRLTALNIKFLSKDSHKIFLIIDERTGISVVEDNFLTLFSISEDVVSKKLTEAGFEVINRNTARNKLDIKELKKALSGDGHIASAIGKSFNADMVIIGNANIKTETGGVQAEINAKVFSVKKEKLIVERNEIASVLTTDRLLGIAQSLRNGSEKILPVLIDFIKKEMEAEKQTANN